MKKNNLFQLVALFAGSVLLAGCTPQPADVTDEISEHNKAFMESFNNGDMAALAQRYTEDAKLFPANAEIVEGRENIEKFWSGAIETGIRKLKLEATLAEGIGNTAIEEGKFTILAEGDVVIGQGKYIVTFEKVNGTWLISRDIWNSNSPPPPGPCLQSGNMFGLHALKMTLKDNVTPEEFEKFYLDEYAPAFEKAFPGTKLHLLKGDRGENKGKYGEFIYFKSLDERNYWLPEPGKFSEKGQEAWSKFQPWQDKLDEKVEWKSVYTDWLVL